MLEALGSLERPITYLTNSVASSPNFFAFSDYWARRGRFQEAGMDIWEYQGPGSIHGKSLVVDGRLAAVGSLNLDDRSIYLDTEAMLVVDSEAFAAQVLEAVDALRAGSLQLDDDGRYIERAALAPAPAGILRRAAMAVMSVLGGLFRFLI